MSPQYLSPSNHFPISRYREPEYRYSIWDRYIKEELSEATYAEQHVKYYPIIPFLNQQPPSAFSGTADTKPFYPNSNPYRHLFSSPSVSRSVFKIWVYSAVIGTGGTAFPICFTTAVFVPTNL